MITGELRINRDKLKDWLELAGLNESQLAKELDVAQGNFSKMLNGEIPTSKTVIERLLSRTLLPINILITFDLQNKNA